MLEVPGKLITRENDQYVTTIGMMLGLVTPTEGEILIENKSIKSFKRDDILKRFNFASPYVELPKKLTVKQNLEIYGRLYGIKI